MLRFYYGTMASGKTATLLMSAYQRRVNRENVLILKPNEKRDKDKVVSRVGLEDSCVVFEPKDNLFDLVLNLVLEKNKNDLYAVRDIYVDESQFLTEKQVFDLYNVARFYEVRVHCFGLLTNFKNQLFEGSNALIRFAKSTQLEPLTTCKYCDEEANTHLLVVDGEIVLDFPEKTEGDVEGDIHFECVCQSCWHQKTRKLRSK